MNEEIKSLDALKEAVGEVTAAEQVQAVIAREPVRDELGRSYATGKRKDAVARVWIKPGSGKVVVNGKEMNKYFARPVLQMILAQPFSVAGVTGEFDVMATVKGGGLSGQAGAVKHGISKALQLYQPSLRPALKAAGFQTHIETSGSSPMSGSWDWVCLSPKKFKAPLAESIKAADELKVVVFNKSDFDWANSFVNDVNTDCKKYLQPEWEKSDAMTPLVIEYIKSNPSWELSAQLHKYIQVP